MPKDTSFKLFKFLMAISIYLGKIYLEDRINRNIHVNVFILVHDVNADDH